MRVCGIGAATARLAAERDYEVCVNYLAGPGRRRSAVKDMGGKQSPWLACRSRPTCCGCSRRGRVARRADGAGQQCRHPRHPSRLETIGAARLQRILATNVVGAFLCAREAIKRMSTNRGGVGGSIVNVSSGASRLGSPGEYVDYAASKGAIDTMTIGLSRNWRTKASASIAFGLALSTRNPRRRRRADRIDRFREASR